MNPYRQLREILSLYRREYGGFFEWLSSPFVHVSAGVALLATANVITLDWRHLAEEVLPTALGFSLAAYTITFTLMGSTLHTALRTAINQRRNVTLLTMVNVTFFHIVFIQVLALFFAIVSNGGFFYDVLGRPEGTNSYPGRAFFLISESANFVGAFLTIYAVTLLFSIAIAMYRLGRLSRSADRAVVVPRSIPPNSNEDQATEDETVNQSEPVTRAADHTLGETRATETPSDDTFQRT